MELAIALSILVLIGLVMYYSNKSKEQAIKKEESLPLVKLGPEPVEAAPEPVKPEPVKEEPKVKPAKPVAKRTRKLNVKKPAAKPAKKVVKKNK